MRRRSPISTHQERIIPVPAHIVAKFIRLIKVMIVVTPFAFFPPVPPPARGTEAPPPAAARRLRHYLYLLFRSGQDQEPMWLVGR